MHRLGDPYQVFTPYWRAWCSAPRRAPEAVLPVMRLPEGLDPGELPALSEPVAGAHSPEVVRGGESEARRRLNAWSRSSLGGYEAAHDDLASATSRASPYLHFGCWSPLEVVAKLQARPGAAPFVRRCAGGT